MRLGVQARGVGFAVKKTVILEDISLVVEPGECVGVLGPSGCGKSTLLRLLSGQARPTSGQVLIGDSEPDPRDLARNRRIGFVPQDDIVHMALSVERALEYAARLRMRPDATEEDHRKAVDAVLAQLDLEERRKLKVKRLSGGQRKRVSIGVELLTRPDLLFMDEPTSGLDPALEEQFMELCRKLSREGRAVIVTTHVLQSLDRFDLVAVMARGRLAYFGPPAQAPAYFGVPGIQEVYRQLQTGDPADMAARFASSPQQMAWVRERLS